MTPSLLAARRDEVKHIANDLRILHKVVGGVVLIFLEAEECPFRFAVPDGYQAEILPLLPAKLRQIADVLEKGIKLELIHGRVP